MSDIPTPEEVQSWWDKWTSGPIGKTPWTPQLVLRAVGAVGMTIPQAIARVRDAVDADELSPEAVQVLAESDPRFRELLD